MTAASISVVDFGSVRSGTGILEPTGLSSAIERILDEDLNFARFRNSERIALGSGASVKASSGVALGATAIVSEDATGAVQLGDGQNDSPNTLRVGTYELLDADGVIPPERFPDSLKNEVLSATVVEQISSNIREIIGDSMTFRGVFSPVSSYVKGDVVLTGYSEFVCSAETVPASPWSVVSSGFIELGDEGSYVRRGEIVDSDISPAADIGMSKINGMTKLREDVTDTAEKVGEILENYVPKSTLGPFASCDYVVLSQSEYDALAVRPVSVLYLISSGT